MFWNILYKPENQNQIVTIQIGHFFVIFKSCIKGCENFIKKTSVYYIRHLRHKLDQRNFGNILKHGNVQSMFEIDVELELWIDDTFAQYDASVLENDEWFAMPKWCEDND